MPDLRYLLFLVCLALATLSQPSLADDELFRLVGQRLEQMQAVAAYKWKNNLPVQDLNREKAVLDQAAQEAVHAGLRAEAARDFFQAQMDAAKEIQYYWIQKWKQGGPFSASPEDLTQIRLRLNDLGEGIIARMKTASTLPIDENTKKTFQHHTQIEGLGNETRNNLYVNLILVLPPEDFNTLDRIRLTGKVRVATTGDYAPFSFAENDGDYTGIDIDMARSLASHLDAEVEWIHTSWPDLLQDLKSNRFDIAMSGISVRKERAEFGHFSIPYHRGGKTPIARCEDKDKYSSLEKINLPGVRVIVNPGGTNYAFASQNISSASLRIHEDNRTIFDEIAEGRADVMITDAIEVTLKTGRDNRLCPTMPGKTLTSLAKAYLAPKDDRFIYKVNIWLKRQIDQGHFKSALEEHMQKEFIRK